MPIENIPAIREDYPLFSWDDHKESFAALKKGGEVAGFKKETWNAIIDKLQSVLTESGISWDKSSYTTAENAKITEAYGELSAAMFNAVRHNIDHPIPVGWKWANDPSFRGYVGRKDFRGYADYGTQCDLFYAEYLIEIVRKLNLLIEMLRGTAPFADCEYKFKIESLYESNLLAKPSAPMVVSENVQSAIIGGLLARPSAPIEIKESAESKTEASIVKVLSKPIDGSESVKTKYSTSMITAGSQPLGGVSEIAWTKHKAVLSSARIQEIFAAAKSNSLHSAETHLLQSAPTGAIMRVDSLQSVELNQGEAEPIIAAERAKSSERAIIELVPSIQIGATATAKTMQSAKMEQAKPHNITISEISASMAAVSLDFAWIPPIKNGTNLYIRQVYDMERNGNDLRLI